MAPAVPVTSLTALLCLTTFTNIVSSGAFPAVLPDIARSAALADWQIGIVAGAFGFARMVADIPLGLFLTRNLRRALWIGPLVLMTGGLCVTTGGGFAAIVFGRLLMGVGQALSMVAGLTAMSCGAHARRNAVLQARCDGRVPMRAAPPSMPIIAESS